MMGLVCGFVTMCLGFPFIATLLEPTPKADLRGKSGKSFYGNFGGWNWDSGSLRIRF